MVGGEGVTLFGPTSRGIEREAALSWEMPDFNRQLTDILEAGSKAPVLILFDGADQTYRKEDQIPKLTPFDRSRYIKRKLDQAFPSYPVRASMLVKPPKEKPFYLFVALPETDRLDELAADMLDAGVLISGFGLLPAESVGLVKTLAEKTFDKADKPSRWAVLISQHETGGLRQVVVKNGTLALTRITPTSEAGTYGPGWADEVMREFKATLTYIARFGYTAEEGLDVMVLCSNIEKQFFSDKSLPVTNFRCLTPVEALNALGMKGVSLGETNFGDAVHCAWAGRKRSLSVPLVVPSVKRIMVPRKVLQILSILFTLTLLAGSGYIGTQYSSYMAVKSNLAGLYSQRDYLKSEYTKESRIFDTYPFKPDVLKKILAIKKSVDDAGVNITPILNLLRGALANDIKLNELTIGYNPPAAKKKIGFFSKTKETGTVKINFKFDITGALSLQQKVDRVNGMVKILQGKFPGYVVDIKHQFGNVSAAGGFQGASGTPPAGASNANGTDSGAAIELSGPPL